MKKITVILYLVTSVICSCTSNDKDAPKERIIGEVPTADTVIENRFANVKFISKYDTSCGMPLSAGLEDTLHYKGGIYGFCSKECKDQFVAKIKKENK